MLVTFILSSQVMVVYPIYKILSMEPTYMKTSRQEY